MVGGIISRPFRKLQWHHSPKRWYWPAGTEIAGRRPPSQPFVVFRDNRGPRRVVGTGPSPPSFSRLIRNWGGGGGKVIDLGRRSLSRVPAAGGRRA